MKQNEIIKELTSLGIITDIAGEFYITEKYKELVQLGKNTVKIEAKVPGKSKANAEEILNTSGSTTSWPADIAHTTGRSRAEAFMNTAGVPAHSPDGTYMLRGLTKESLGIIDNIVNSESISPIDMLKAIGAYYKHTKMPKAFKNLLIEGLVIEIYNEFIAGTFIKNISPKNQSNEKWR